MVRRERKNPRSAGLLSEGLNRALRSKGWCTSHHTVVRDEWEAGLVEMVTSPEPKGNHPSCKATGEKQRAGINLTPLSETASVSSKRALGMSAMSTGDADCGRLAGKQKQWFRWGQRFSGQRAGSRQAHVRVMPQRRGLRPGAIEMLEKSLTHSAGGKKPN